jgi:hypothetical protein
MSDIPPSDDPSTRDSIPRDAIPEDQPPEVVTPDAVTSDEPSPVVDPNPVTEQTQVTEPAKVMRIGSMIKLLLEEVRATSLDEASRERLAEVYERSITELSSALSPELQDELRTLTLPFGQDEIPSEAEIRVAKAQLVGWLEGLFHGIQASLMAQQLAAHQQLQGIRQLPGGLGGDMPGNTPGEHATPDQSGADRPGTYL